MNKPSEPSKLANAIVTALEEVKGQNITVLPVTSLTWMTDTMIFCTATSNRHAQALARNADAAISQLGYQCSMEGENSSDWILLDAGDALVHIMLADTRTFYDVESLWQTDELLEKPAKKRKAGLKLSPKT